MEATFVVNPQEVDEKLLGKMLDFFKDKKQPVTVKLTATDRENFDWKAWFKEKEEIRASMAKNPVPTGIGIGDLDDLIDTINDNEL